MTTFELAAALKSRSTYVLAIVGASSCSLMSMAALYSGFLVSDTPNPLNGSTMKPFLNLSSPASSLTDRVFADASRSDSDV